MCLTYAVIFSPLCSHQSVMIAQWDRLLPVLPVAMIAQRDSSPSVLPVARVMIAQWDSSPSVLPAARLQCPTMAQYFGVFLWLITCAALYTVQRVPQSGVAPPREKGFSLMKIKRSLRSAWFTAKKSSHLLIGVTMLGLTCLISRVSVRE